MSIVVTGATGQLGRLVVQALLQRGVPAQQIIATGRRTQALADLADRGIVVRRADFNDEASLPEAFAGADKLLLVSGSEAGQRVHQHANAINAAKAAGVRFIAYTSGVRADTSTLLVMSCCATAGIWRTTPASCRSTSSAASSARPAPGW